MKKLVLLAVVVFGFAAASQAQKQAGAQVIADVQAATSANAALSIGWVNDMNFAKITASATGGNIYLLPNGTFDASSTLSAVGTPKAATFKITGLMSGNPNLSVTPRGNNHIGNNVYFETDESPYFCSYANNGGGNFTVSLGGRLTLPANFVGAISIPNVTVTVNNP